MLDQAESAALRRRCDRFLVGHGPIVAADLRCTATVREGIGALAGCCVVGEDGVVAEVREWRRRLGGTLHGLWPAAASALTLLARRLPRMPAYLEHTLAIADALRGVEGVTVLPDPPQTPMFHLLLDASIETIDAPTGDPRTQRTEIAVGDATLAIPAEDIARLLAGLVVPG